MKILALDTSGLTASVAVIDGDMLLAQFSIQYKTTHSQILMPMLDAIKNLTNLDLQTIDAVAVAAGPGSFTGLRIGAATAKALCLALDKPLIPVPTVDALAYNLYGSETVICPMMDARRGQVYTGIYSFDMANERRYVLHAIEEQFAASIEDVAAKLNAIGRPVTLLGDGVPVYKEKLQTLLTVPYHEAPLFQNRQNAAALAALAAQYAAAGQMLEDGDVFVPVYLRPSQAEREGGSPDGGKKRKPVQPALRPRVFIRPMREEDLDAAAALETTNMGAEAWTRDQLATAMQREDTIYLVAEKSDKVVGLCGLQNISGDGSVTNVSVAEETRGEGIGSKMLHQLLERGKGLGVIEYTLEVRAGNAPAIALYEKMGFASEGVRPGFYSAPKEDAVIYWKRKKEND